MAKRMLIMLVIVGLLFGGIFGYHAFVSHMTKKYMAGMKPPPVAVSTIKAEFHPWQPQLKAIGSLRAVRGVEVTSEITGLVRSLHFKSGEEVREGQLLVELNADSDVARLHSLEAAAELANTVYERDKKQFAVQAISRAALDGEEADLRSKRAQVAEQEAIVRKKTITAPFAGRLGITTVNPGQYVNPGDKIVTLQSLDFVYVDFYLPQQELSRIAHGQTIVAATDTYPGRTFTGKIATINPKVDTDTRNVEVEGIFGNPKRELLPGMYVSVEVMTGEPERYLTLPQTAITFNPYGETVYIVDKSGKTPEGKPLLTAKQTFVTAGGTRGDQVAILKGVKEGDTVITSGQLKLKNGSVIVVNNKVQPSNDAAPRPADE
ncbi:MAG: efflux RND transporter periplasmic adaptor subunit [Nitrospirae bacterium]|nr:efflux RND transporter periplasmic adaptor subunit [Nitrospirota bacterium]